MEDDEKINHKKKNKDVGQCPLEMIDNIAQNMEKLENIVIGCCSDSDESEQLSQRQKTRLEFLKQKRQERKEKVAKYNMHENRKMGPDVNVITKNKNFDNKL